MNTEVASVIMARGLLDVFELSSTTRSAVRQDAACPASTRRALTLLSGICLSEGVGEDLGASIHVAMDRACLPMGEWGIPGFTGNFKYADVVLVDRDLGVPTEDCREMARQGGSELSVLEEIQHDSLRTAVSGYPARLRNAAYSSLREFVVRNPAVPYPDILAFIMEGGHAAAAKALADFYRPLPQAALFGASARRCGHCGSLLWPDRDLASYPAGRCRIRQCRLAHPKPDVGETIDDPAEWRLATSEVLAYWVGPGLDEIRIHDSLAAAGRKVVLYPQADAADVGVDGLEIGIDAKAYASPVVLGAHLTRSIGRLEMFRRKYLVVPDDKLRTNPRYLEQLAATYAGSTDMLFRSASAVIAELSA
jgi:hypothetical protein